MDEQQGVEIDGAEKTETTSSLGRPIWMIEKFALDVWRSRREESGPMHSYRIVIVRKIHLERRKGENNAKEKKTPFKC